MCFRMFMLHSMCFPDICSIVIHVETILILRTYHKHFFLSWKIPDALFTINFLVFTANSKVVLISFEISALLHFSSINTCSYILLMLSCLSSYVLAYINTLNCVIRFKFITFVNRIIKYLFYFWFICRFTILKAI